MLAKLIGGDISYAPRKIVVDGKTIFNPGEDTLKEQGYKDVETTSAPEVHTQTQQVVPSWTEQENKIVQTWELKPAQPDPTVALQEIQTQAIIEKIKSSEDKTLGIQFMALFPVWERGNYAEGDVRTDPDTGYPYECIVAHDSITNTGDDWTIKNRALWAAWHSRKKEYALPWEKPETGTSGIYHVGEYMIWTDGTVKKCLRDTNFSPEEYTADWEDA